LNSQPLVVASPTPRPPGYRATHCHISVLLVHFKLYDYAVYCNIVQSEFAP